MNEPNPTSPNDPNASQSNEPKQPAANEPKANPISETVHRAWDTTKAKAGDALQSGERYVRDHPGTSVLSMFGMGVLVGLAVGWSIAHETHESYMQRALKMAKRLGNKFNLD